MLMCSRLVWQNGFNTCNHDSGDFFFSVQCTLVSLKFTLLKNMKTHPFGFQLDSHYSHTCKPNIIKSQKSLLNSLSLNRKRRTGDLCTVGYYSSEMSATTSLTLHCLKNMYLFCFPESALLPVCRFNSYST